MWGKIIAIILIIVAIILAVVWARNRKEANAGPVTVSSSGDGSWWQVRQGDHVLRSMGTRPSGAIYEGQCETGVMAIGDEGGPVYCSDGKEVELVPDAKSNILYGLGDGCPSGWRKDPLRHADGAVSYICHPDIECVSHTNCDPGHICDGGRCIPIPDF